MSKPKKTLQRSNSLSCMSRGWGEGATKSSVLGFALIQAVLGGWWDGDDEEDVEEAGDLLPCTATTEP